MAPRPPRAVVPRLVAALALAAVLLVVSAAAATATESAGVPAAGGGDATGIVVAGTDGTEGSHPAELQPGPEDGQEQFGEPSDERTERVVRILRNVLGGAVAVVILLLVIVLPLRLRRREAARAEGDDEHGAGATDDEARGR